MRKEILSYHTWRFGHRPHWKPVAPSPQMHVYFCPPRTCLSRKARANQGVGGGVRSPPFPPSLSAYRLFTEAATRLGLVARLAEGTAVLLL